MSLLTSPSSPNMLAQRIVTLLPEGQYIVKETFAQLGIIVMRLSTLSSSMFNL